MLIQIFEKVKTVKMFGFYVHAHPKKALLEYCFVKIRKHIIFCSYAMIGYFPSSSVITQQAHGQSSCHCRLRGLAWAQLLDLTHQGFDHSWFQLHTNGKPTLAD